MNMIAENVDKEISVEYILKATDRCDQCGAEALVLVKGVSGDLMFCGHHYNKNEAALIKFSYEIIDERNKLVQDKLKDEKYV
jgi:hypothetical protein